MMARSILRFTLTALLLVTVLPQGRLAAVPVAEELDEYDVKAALFYKFAKFITWPDEAFEGENSPVVFGVFGEDPFGESLDRTLEGRNIGGREIVIRRFTQPSEARDCHSLFVSRTSVEALPEVVKATRKHPVLLVGDTPRFAHDGGVINMYRRGSSVRFEINTDAAERADLTIDAKLLQLARIIRD